MKLTLHIGTPKSGTTTIQRFLTGNRDLLRAHGVLVPVSLGKKTHRRLPAMVQNDGVVDDFLRRQGLQERAARLAAKRLWKDEFAAEMDNCPCPHVVISSEHLQSRLRQPENIRALSDMLRTWFSDIRVILYIRDPLDTVVSLYSTSVKSGGELAGLPVSLPAEWAHIVSHRDTIRRWQDNLEPDALVPRLFQKEDFRQGDLLADFISAAGLPELDYMRPERANESLNGLGLELLRRLNRDIPPFLPDGRVNPLRGNLKRFFETHFNTGAPFVPEARAIAACEAAFADSNDWVRQQFFPERAQLFTPRARSAADGGDLSSADLDQMAALTADLWRRWRKKVLQAKAGK